MKTHRWVVIFGALLLAGIGINAAEQEKASPQELIAKVRDAGRALANSSQQPGGPNLAQFDEKQSPWVWKDTYIFVVDCGQGIIAAHPVNPELRGKSITNILDSKGTPFFWQVCDALKRPSGVWFEYWWPKPGQKVGSRKISYALRAGNTSYVVVAGVYDDKANIADLQKLTPAAK